MLQWRPAVSDSASGPSTLKTPPIVAAAVCSTLCRCRLVLSRPRSSAGDVAWCKDFLGDGSPSAPGSCCRKDDEWDAWCRQVGGVLVWCAWVWCTGVVLVCHACVYLVCAVRVAVGSRRRKLCSPSHMSRGRQTDNRCFQLQLLCMSVLGAAVLNMCANTLPVLAVALCGCHSHTRSSATPTTPSGVSCVTQQVPALPSGR